MAWAGNNTNDIPNTNQFGNNLADKVVTTNRSYNIRRDTDKFSDFHITLEDVDATIIDFLENGIQLSTIDNGENIKVPVIYGNPEKWAAIKQYGHLRDNNGKLQLPAFMFSRTTVENNETLATFNKHVNYQVLRSYTEKNKYDRFDILTGNKPTQQLINVKMPQHVICEYECVIWTDRTDQNNMILQQINPHRKDYWGTRDRFKFRTNIQNYSIETITDDNNDRSVKSEFTLIVNAYLLDPEVSNKLGGPESTTQKLFTIRKIKLNEQIVSSHQLSSIQNNQSDPDKSKLVSKYTLDNNSVVKLDQNAIRTEIVDNDKKYIIYKTPFHPVPKSPLDYGENGWMAYDKEYLYVYQYPKGWMKASLSEFDYDPSNQTYISEYDCYNNPVYVTGSMRPLNTAFRVFNRFPDKFYQQVPLQSDDYGEDGWVSYDGEYLYVYSSNKWRRIPISANFS